MLAFEASNDFGKLRFDPADLAPPELAEPVAQFGEPVLGVPPKMIEVAHRGGGTVDLGFDAEGDDRLELADRRLARQIHDSRWGEGRHALSRPSGANYPCLILALLRFDGGAELLQITNGEALLRCQPVELILMVVACR